MKNTFIIRLVVIAAFLATNAQAESFRFEVVKDVSQGGCCDSTARFTSLSQGGMKVGDVSLLLEGNDDYDVKKNQFLIAAHPHFDMDFGPNEYVIFTSIRSKVKGTLQMVYTMNCKPAQGIECPKDENTGETIKTVISDMGEIEVGCGTTKIGRYPATFDDKRSIAILNIIQSFDHVSGKLDINLVNSSLCKN